jgi:hypothetical protein
MSVKITVTGNYDRWIRGFEALPAQVRRASVREFDQANREFFEATQDVVHVITGELKRSGTGEVRTVGPDVVATVEYDAEYAIYEEARGGEHAFMTRGWEATEHLFADAMPEAFQNVVASWR